MLSRANIESRIVDLRQQFKKTENLLASIDGAIQDCEYWLGFLEGRGQEASTSAPENETLDAS